MLTKEQVSKLLNRSLTASEDSNFEMYLKIATERLEELLCMSLCGDDSDRTYAARNGYRTLFTDPFTDVTSVTIDGTEVDAGDYLVKQNDRYSGGWYNSIEFDTPMHCKKIVVEADWGFDCLPVDLQLLLAKLFAQGSVEQRSDNQVKSKKIEDFTVTYKDGTTFDEFVSANQHVISKYSLCNVGDVQHGSIRSFCYDRLYFS